MNSKVKGSFYMMASALAFAGMQILIALTAGEIPLFEQLFFRNLIAAFIAYMNIKKLKLPMFGSKDNRILLILRSLMGYFGMITLFYASGNGTQGDVTIISKMSPFFVTILACIFLKEKIKKYQIVALIVAFIGAMIVANPEMNSSMFPLFVAFLSAIFSGAAYTCVGALKGKENPSVIIFFFSFFSTICTLPVMIAHFVVPSPLMMILLLMIGIFAAIGQQWLTLAYVHANAGEVSIYNYSGIIFSMILGAIFLGQSIQINSVVGAFFVIISGFIVYHFNSKN